MLGPIRRVVTGHNAAGKSVVIFDSAVSPAPDLPTDVSLWVTDQTPATVAGGADAASRPARLEPPAGGSVFRVVEFPPASAFAGLSAAQVEEVMAGLFRQLGATHTRIDTSRGPGMHRTKTVDYVVLLAGQITLILDEGDVDLAPFDVVVQRGTNHGWINKGTTPALLAVVMLDAEPA